jgi:N-acetyl-anhydromuramyl-L-alanine amidase AmpD
VVLALVGCGTVPREAKVHAIPGDEIIAAGQRFHTGTRVVTWLESNGYNGYAGVPPLLVRRSALREAQKAIIERNGWDLPSLQRVVDQFVLHYDASGTSRVCFRALQSRQLSIHFLLDIDGTVYQTLDLQERALHATTSNDRSIGIEIANIGAYPPDAAQPLEEWYQRQPDGSTQLTIPKRFSDPRILTADFRGHPARPDRVEGIVQDHRLVQYDFTPEQYATLVKLTAALCRVFPKIRPDYPHAFFRGEPFSRKMNDSRLARYRGILGHYHLQKNKVDPGPAFDWRRFRNAVRRELP